MHTMCLEQSLVQGKHSTEITITVFITSIIDRKMHEAYPIWIKPEAER